MSDENDKFILTYNHDKRFFIKSRDFIGDIKTYPSTQRIQTVGPCVYVKKRVIVNKVKSEIEK